MDLEDAGLSVKFILHDRDSSFTAAFDAVFQAAGARVVRSAIRAPRMNSIMERWIGSCRRELLDRTLVWNQRHLVTVLREYEDFYNYHRPHRTLSQAAPPAARWHRQPGLFPRSAAPPSRRCDSRISPGGIGFRHAQHHREATGSLHRPRRGPATRHASAPLDVTLITAVWSAHSALRYMVPKTAPSAGY
jgi:hypothetical protein